MAKQLEEAKNRGGTREALVYGVIAVLCILSGRIDPTAIVMRIVVIGICALLAKQFGFLQF